MDLQMSQYYKHLQSHAQNYAAEIVHISLCWLRTTRPQVCSGINYDMGASANSEPQRPLYFIFTAVVTEYSRPTPRMHYSEWIHENLCNCSFVYWWMHSKIHCCLLSNRNETAIRGENCLDWGKPEVREWNDKKWQKFENVSLIARCCFTVVRDLQSCEVHTFRVVKWTILQCLIIFFKTLNFHHVMVNAYHIKIFSLKPSFHWNSQQLFST